MKKRYSFYTDDSNTSNALKKFLNENNFDWEPSGCGRGTYFTIDCTPVQADRINRFLATRT